MEDGLAQGGQNGEDLPKDTSTIPIAAFHPSIGLVKIDQPSMKLPAQKSQE